MVLLKILFKYFFYLFYFIFCDERLLGGAALPFLATINKELTGKFVNFVVFQK